MVDQAQWLPADDNVAGEPCGWCGVNVMRSEELAVCTRCAMPHHAACWRRCGGCGLTGCDHAPTQSPSASKSHAPGILNTDGREAPNCAHCGKPMAPFATQCSFCQSQVVVGTNPLPPAKDGMAPGAVGALAWGIVSILGCGLIVGWVAIAFADKAKKAIKANPEYKGDGMAAAGQALGILGIVLGVLRLLGAGGMF